MCRTHVQPLGTPVSHGGTRQGRGRDGEGPSSVPHDTAHRRLRAAWGALPLRADPQQAAAEPGPLLAKACGPTATVTHCMPETEESLPRWWLVLTSLHPQDHEAGFSRPTPGKPTPSTWACVRGQPKRELALQPTCHHWKPLNQEAECHSWLSPERGTMPCWL